FAISAPKTVRFPLMLRIPAWCDTPEISVNGQSLPVPKPAHNWVRLERTWRDGDKVRLELPMKVSATVWKKNRNTVSVNRGPISYSLKIGERWERSGGTDEWPEHEVYPTAPWNYGLVIDTGNPAASFEVVKKQGPLARQPFTVDDAPIMLRAKGKRIPEWGLEPNGFIEEVQPGPVHTEEPAEEIT
ncbi:MAG: hypothetical protein GY953_03070, partial [bacterium]|nr:hypothetical protein [bacterium]